MFVVLESVCQTSATKEIEHNMNPYIVLQHMPKKQKCGKKMIFRAQNGKNNARCPHTSSFVPKIKQNMDHTGAPTRVPPTLESSQERAAEQPQ
jgi:hypothetical protein